MQLNGSGVMTCGLARGVVAYVQARLPAAMKESSCFVNFLVDIMILQALASKFMTQLFTIC